MSVWFARGLKPRNLVLVLVLVCEAERRDRTRCDDVDGDNIKMDTEEREYHMWTAVI